MARKKTTEEIVEVLTEAEQKELEYQSMLKKEEEAASAKPIFVIEEDNLKELNDYITLLEASKRQNVLDTGKALEALIMRLQKYIKRQ